MELMTVLMFMFKPQQHTRTKDKQTRGNLSGLQILIYGKGLVCSSKVEEKPDQCTPLAITKCKTSF